METETTSVTPNGNTAHTDDGQSIAVISYLTIIGWLIAYVMHNNNKTALGAFHLRQTMTLYIICICLWILQTILLFIPYIGWAIDVLLIFVYIGLLVLWLIGLIAAINRQEKLLPILGTKAQQWFGGIR